MFKKVLVAEDMDDINKGIVTTLQELGILNIHQVQYCDDALLKIKKAQFDHDDFELLITDLSFDKDHRAQVLTSGEELAQEVRSKYPKLKIIMYSVEDRPQKVRHMIKKLGIHAYVCKGRHGLKDLSKSIEEVYNDKIYLSEHIQNALKPNQRFNIEEFDLLLLKNLSLGSSQEEISSKFKSSGFSPSSLSSIEKRINKLKLELKANNAIHLVSKAKDLGLI